MVDLAIGICDDLGLQDFEFYVGKLSHELNSKIIFCYWVNRHNTKP